ncbi:hypothetical protein Rhal01_00103 [Rubritalea halochordaticola]|uniref:Uncharacterized protein n=2 Tax=Rubritalea halochordaticola TaxID=714537 RepID=A0ABP9UU62_9BACT
MMYMSSIKKTLLAGVASLSIGHAYANTNIDGLLAEGSHWNKACEAASKDFPNIEWESKGGVWNIKDDDLKLWNRNVETFKMSSSSGKIRHLTVGITSTDSKPVFLESLETWKAVMNSRLGEEGRESASSSAKGGVVNVRWRQESYLASLTGKEESGKYSLTLNYRPISEPPASVAKEQDKFDGIYERTFYSPDYSKSFRGTVLQYDEQTMMVKIEKGRSVMSVNLDQLSDRDADYIDRVSGLLAASNGLALQIKEIKDKPDKNGRAITVNTRFDLSLINNSPNEIKEVELRYDIFYKEDTLDGAPVLKMTSGSVQLGDIFANYRETNSTEGIGIVRESKPGVSGG